MNVAHWVESLASRGVQLEADDGRLRIRAPKGALDADDRAALSSRKEELIAHLSADDVADPPGAEPRPADLPLSFAQQRLWFLFCLGQGEGKQGDDAYNISAALRLDGALDEQALQRALTEIVRRHEALRTRIVALNGTVAQCIDEAPAAVLDCETLSDEDHPEIDVLSRARAFAAARFDLSAGPLFRARLWRIGRSSHLLAIAVHHIVFDGWSLNVLMRELSALYAAFSAGRPSPLPPLPIQYADYAVWQRRLLSGRRLERHAAYWRERLGGAPAQSTILPDRPRPAVATTRGDAVRFQAPRAVAQAIRTLAQQRQATTFMALLAAWALLLGRMSGQQDLVIGTPIANRHRLELESLLGLFANTLALRIDLAKAASLGDLLAQTRATTLEAYERQDMPFEQVVDAVEPERRSDHHPLFQTAFVLQNAASRRPLELPGLSATAVPLELDTAKFDLTLEVSERADGFDARLEYNSDLYTRSTAEALARRWTLILEAMAKPGAAELPLSAFTAMTPDEADRKIRKWGSHSRPYRDHLTLAAAFAEHAARQPDAIAVVCGERRLTYGALEERANRLARHLLATGCIGPDALVGLAIERSLDLIVALLGILKAGAAYLPLDPADPADRLKLLLSREAPLVVTTGAFAGRLPAYLRRICVDDEADAIAQRPASAPDCAAQPASLAYALFTSGSTGEPKGVLVEQRSILRLVDDADYAGLGADSVVLHLAPLSFDASTFEIWGPLLNGGRLALMDAGTPSLEEIGAAIRRHGVNTLWLTAGLFQAMADERIADFAPLQWLIAGGDVLSPAHVARVLAAHPHLTVVNGYGPTETTTFAATYAMRAGEALGSRVPIGRPIGNTYLYVRDRQGELAPPGAVGELYIGGDGVARGYWRRPDLTAERFLPDPWRPGGRVYRTGDLARWRSDGVLEFLGRRDDQVKIRGFRIELGEIEAAIASHPDVASAAVAAQKDPSGGKRLAAYYVPRAGAEPSAKSIASWLEERLPRHLRPQSWQALSEIPLTANGKIDRARLPAPPARPTLEEPVAPSTPVERVLAGIWATLLGRENIGVHDNFFELGGDSILSLQIVARCREAGLVLLPQQIFDHQTIAELAPRVTAEADASVAVRQDPISGTVTPGPIQRWFYELRLAAPHHFNQSVLLSLAPQVTPAILREAFASLVLHHDMLRLRVDATGEEPRQWIAPPGEEIPIEIASPRDADESEGSAMILARAQARLDLANGPILRAVLLPGAAVGATRLLVVIHHLAVDGVSWRILLEDLETACEAALAGRPITFPRKTLAFQDWAERLLEHAQSDAVDRQLDFWRAMPASESALAPAAGDAANLVGDAQKARRVLSPALTRDLLQRSPRAYNTRVEDVLLTALLLSFRRLSGHAHLRIDLEGHGRDSFDPTLDLSRTVGWFSCIYPIDLSLEADGLESALIGVKEQLRRVPGNGLAYGLGKWLRPRGVVPLPALSGIVFNYLGQFDQMLTRTRLIRVCDESSGPNQGPSNRRSCEIEILSMVFDGQLRLEWHYHPERHSRGYVEAWADSYVQALSQLVEHCCNAENGRYTPSDFPSVALEAVELDQLQALAAAASQGGPS